MKTIRQLCITLIILIVLQIICFLPALFKEINAKNQLWLIETKDHQQYKVRGHINYFDDIVDFTDIYNTRVITVAPVTFKKIEQ